MKAKRQALEEERNFREELGRIISTQRMKAGRDYALSKGYFDVVDQLDSIVRQQAEIDELKRRAAKAREEQES